MRRLKRKILGCRGKYVTAWTRYRTHKGTYYNRRRRSSAATSSICASAAWRLVSSVTALPRSTATARSSRDDGRTLGCEGAFGDERSAARSIVCGCGGGAGGGARAGVGFTNVVDVAAPGGGPGGTRERGGLTGAAPWV